MKKNMIVRKKFAFICFYLAALSCFMLICPAYSAEKTDEKSIQDSDFFAQSDEHVKRAMQDEMQRSLSRLQMDELQKPYFIAYTVADSVSSYYMAEFGTLSSVSDPYRNRKAKAEVRVGDKSFDSSLFVGDPYGSYEPIAGHSAAYGDYDSLRYSLWRLTDAAYKNALDSYAKKEAFVQSRNITELYDDLVPAPSIQQDYAGRTASFDNEKAKNLVRRLSALFREYPDIAASNVSIYHKNAKNYFLNSEGSRFSKISCSGALSFHASALAQDGHILSASDKIEFCDAEKELPGYDSLAEKARKLAQRLSLNVKSETIKAYIGPVLFEKGAAGKFLEGLFVNNVANPREIWKAESQWSPGYIYSRSGDLNERLGMRVFPPFISVYDDPSQETYNGIYLLGSYKADDEGVPAERVMLVNRGILKDYYRFRAQTKDFSASNGHGRASVSENITGGPGNVFIWPDETSSHVIPSSDMKAKLMELCKEQELEYGLIVRYLGGLNSAFGAYKVYADGHEEPAHSLLFTGLGLRSLRDIAYVSKEKNVYSLNWSPDASLIHPDIIVMEMEVKKSLQKPPKKPYLPHPFFSKKK